MRRKHRTIDTAAGLVLVVFIAGIGVQLLAQLGRVGLALALFALAAWLWRLNK